MKKIAVIALYEPISRYYKENLDRIFGDCVETESYYIEGNPQTFEFDGDVIVVSSTILYEYLHQLNHGHKRIIVMKRTFTKRGFEKIKQLHPGEKLLFISNFHEIAIECVSKLYELGVGDIKLIPYNPQSPYSTEQTGIRKAVTAGDVDAVPGFIDEVIDLGDRVIDVPTVADIGAHLGLPTTLQRRIIEKYKADIMYTDLGISRAFDDFDEVKRQFKTIINFYNDSIIATDLHGRITEYNEASVKVFGPSMENAVGKKIQEVFPKIGIQDIRKGTKRVLDEVVTIDHVPYVINKYGVFNDKDVLVGTVIMGQKYMEMEAERNRLRKKLTTHGHTAKYTIDSILGQSGVIQSLKKTAERMAQSSSTVLITGESGTGKEVFAQAIHNASCRRQGPFVAVNCSAIVPSLLESELFGYEAGAFTGAKKGGRIGLFEMADKGTIFLDEIGEMPYELQSKLLRVLMEREIMHIGGNDVIRIDVRVIAATNKDLVQLIREGRFREDLYYRINVLPLKLPPLRERKEDIECMTRYFMSSFGEGKKIAPSAVEAMLQYDWPGNVRELHNCVEYMCQFSDGEITRESLPPQVAELGKVGEKGDGREYLTGQPGLNEMEYMILSVIHRRRVRKLPVGRKVLAQALAQLGVRIPEQEIRFFIKSLEEKELVVTPRGRAGSSLTSKGVRLLQQMGRVEPGYH